MSRKVKKTLTRNGVKGTRAFGCILSCKVCNYALFVNTMLKNTPKKVGFMKTTDHQPTDPPTTYHLPAEPPTTYPPTHRPAIINLR